MGGGSYIAFGHYCLSEARKNVTVLLSWKGDESKEGVMESLEILPKCQCPNCLRNYICGSSITVRGFEGHGCSPIVLWFFRLVLDGDSVVSKQEWCGMYHMESYAVVTMTTQITSVRVAPISNILFLCVYSELS